MQLMRLFIAIDLPDPVKQALANLQDSLCTLPTDAKWVKPSHTHLTLKFLGETSTEQIPSIQETLREISGAFASFVLRLAHLGGFPTLRLPKVLWIALEGDTGRLNSIVARLNDRLGAESRLFVPHLTLARINRITNTNSFQEKIHHLPPMPSTSFTVDSLKLFQSVLTPQGPQYTELFSSPLKR